MFNEFAGNGMELAPALHKSFYVRVVTIKHPPPALDGPPTDNPAVGTIYDVSPQLAILMIAAGWMRGETRTRARRDQDCPAGVNRRQVRDRRSTES